MDRRASIFVAALFLATILAPGLIQTVAELRDGERPRALEVFRRPPTAANLHAYERTSRRRASSSSGSGRGRSTSSGGSSPTPARRPSWGATAGFSIDRASSTWSSADRCSRGRSRRSPPRDPIVPRSAPGAGGPPAGRPGAQQGERLSRDACRAGGRRGSHRLRADASPARPVGAVRHRIRRPVRGLPPRQAGGGPVGSRVGSTWRRTATGRRRVPGWPP